VVETLCFLVCQRHHLACPVCKSLKHLYLEFAVFKVC
jgi:hypothetical protein